MIDPGDGFRLLMDGDILQEGDEYWRNVSDGRWIRSRRDGPVPKALVGMYRRALSTEANLVPADSLRTGDVVWNSKPRSLGWSVLGKVWHDHQTGLVWRKRPVASECNGFRLLVADTTTRPDGSVEWHTGIIKPVRYQRYSETQKPFEETNARGVEVFWFDTHENRQLTRLEAVAVGLEKDPYTKNKEVRLFDSNDVVAISDLWWAHDLAKPMIEVGFQDQSGEEFE